MGARKNKIIEANFTAIDRLIRRLSVRYSRDRSCREDLYQSGWEICLRLTARYDSRRNPNFMGYLNHPLASEMIKEARKTKMSSSSIRDVSDASPISDAVMEAIEELDCELKDLIYSHFYCDVSLRDWGIRNKLKLSDVQEKYNTAINLLRPKMLERGLWNDEEQSEISQSVV